MGQQNKYRRCPAVDKLGQSSILTLQYVYALNYAAQLNDAFRQTILRRPYRENLPIRSKNPPINSAGTKRGLLSDTPDKKIFSQHANILAVLVDLVPPNEQKKIMEKVVSDGKKPYPVHVLFPFLSHPSDKVGFGDRYIEMLQPCAICSKWASQPSPKIPNLPAPIATPGAQVRITTFLATVLGITPAEPGFKSVRIEPHLGPLTWVEGKVPHPSGEKQSQLERKW